MAAAKTSDAVIRYHVADTANNHLVVEAGAAGTKTIRLVVGGNIITLGQQNVTDLLPAFAAFSTTGVLA
jgi:hypothetical protein